MDLGPDGSGILAVWSALGLKIVMNERQERRGKELHRNGKLGPNMLK